MTSLSYNPGKILRFFWDLLTITSIKIKLEQDSSFIYYDIKITTTVSNIDNDIKLINYCKVHVSQNN